MVSFSINGMVQAVYLYNAAGHQVIRKLPAQGVTIHSVHDSAGRRIAEYNEATGTLIREYVWLGWDPVAVIEGGVVYYIRADHIGRPALATNASGAVVWSLSYTPFGEVHSQTGLALEARFPGQWYQAETGLHQNWMLDYDPTTGRYLQADPLGLIDGASVYGYVRQNPGRYTDPTGECPWCVVGGIIILVTILTPEPANAPGICEAVLPPEPLTPYINGLTAGLGAGTGRFAYFGYELKFGSNYRFAPFGNRTGNKFGKWPHYHRRGDRPGQGIGRHRPWETKSPDRSFWDRF